MKRVILSLIIIMVMASVCFAQNGLINQNQIQQHIVNCVAGENLTAGDVVSLINSYGTVTAKKNNLAVNTSPNGAERVFNSAATTYCSAVALDSTRFLVAYKDSDNKPYAIVGTVSGSLITWGSESAVLENYVCYDISVCKINTDKVLVAYRKYDGVSTYNLRVVTLSISTNSITVNTAGVANVTASTNTSWPSLSTLENDKAILCYGLNDGSWNDGTAIIISVSGTTCSVGTPATFNDVSTASTEYISCSALSSTSAIVAYKDGGNSNYGTSQVLSISGTTITPGTEYVFKSTNATSYCSVAALSTTSAIINFSYTSDKGSAIVASVSGTTISYGSAVDWFNGTMNYNSVVAIDSAHALLSGDSTSLGGCRNVIANISGTTITYNTVYNIQVGGSGYNANYIGSCYLGNQKSAFAYANSNTGYGTCCINTWVTPSYDSIRGLCTTTTTSGNSAPILLSGVATGLSSIVAGSPYFVDASFGLSTSAVSLTGTKGATSGATGEIYFGTGLSTTTMYVAPDYR